MLLVDNQSISGAIEAVFNDKRSILEPAGAVAVAGATQYLEKHNLQVSTSHHPHSAVLSVGLEAYSCMSVLIDLPFLLRSTRW